jgi:hypothetical protein
MKSVKVLTNGKFERNIDLFYARERQLENELIINSGNYLRRLSYKLLNKNIYKKSLSIQYSELEKESNKKKYSYILSDKRIKTKKIGSSDEFDPNIISESNVIFYNFVELAKALGF